MPQPNFDDPITWAILRLMDDVEDRLTPSRAADIRFDVREEEWGLAVEMLTYGLSGEEDFEPATLSVHEWRAVLALCRVMGPEQNNHLDLDLDAPDHFICRVCGYPGLERPPTSVAGRDSFEICPSCGFDGNAGRESHASYRQKWITAGKGWQHGTPPPGFDPDKQLDNLRRTDRSALVHRLQAAGCVFAEQEAIVLLQAAEEGADLEAMTARREAGEALEYIVGHAQFFGLRIHVTTGVFIPRRRTRDLVATTFRRTNKDAVCLDLCCGSGALGAAFAMIHPEAEVHAADIDPVAVACARRNVEYVYLADLFDGLPEHLRGRIDVVLANVPYVPTGELNSMPFEAREHEPRSTHDGGVDGHDVLRRVLAEAPRWVKPGGLVFTEIAESQVDSARTVFSDAGFALEIVTEDYRDSTIAIGTVPYP